MLCFANPCSYMILVHICLYYIICVASILCYMLLLFWHCFFCIWYGLICLCVPFFYACLYSLILSGYILLYYHVLFSFLFNLNLLFCNSTLLSKLYAGVPCPWFLLINFVLSLSTGLSEGSSFGNSLLYWILDPAFCALSNSVLNY